LQQGKLLHDFAPDSMTNAQLKAIATYLLHGDQQSAQAAAPQPQKTGWLSNIFAGRTPQTAGGR
jgi:hypothetical protein